MSRKYSSGGITVSGLIYVSIIFGVIAVVGMKLFPLYSEKMKVDHALQNVANQKGSAQLSKSALVKLIGRQFEISEVRRWKMSEFSRLLKIHKIKGKKTKNMVLQYEIRGPLFRELDVVLKYDNTFTLGQPLVE